MRYLTWQRAHRNIIRLALIPWHKLNILLLIILITLYTLLSIYLPTRPRNLPLPVAPLPHQPPILLTLLVRLTRQTPLRNPYVLPDILHQRILTHIVILGPYEPQDDEAQLRAVKIRLEVGEDVDLDAARGVFIVWVVADAEDCGVHGGASGGGDRGGVFEVEDGVGGGFGWRGGVGCCAGDAGGGGLGGDGGVVERAEAVVDS